MRQWASPCSSDTSIRQTEWKLAAPLGPYDRALTPPSHSTQAQLLGSLIESQHRKHKALYIRVLSAKAWDGGWAASVLHNRAVTYTSHISYRCVCIRKTYERPHMEYMLNVWAQTPFYSFYSIFSASFFVGIRSFQPVSYLCLCTHTQTDRDVSILQEGLNLIFFSVTHFKERSNHCCLGADACGVISLQNPWKRHFSRLAPWGSEGVF